MSDKKDKNDTLASGIIMPISGSNESPELTMEHFSHVKKIIQEVVSGIDKFNISNADVISSSLKTSVITQNIINGILNDDIVVVDLSNNNGNVLFELGLRLAFGKPLVLIKDNATKSLFDISAIKYIEYPRSLEYCEIQEFKKTLSTAIIDTLSNQEASATLFEELFSTMQPINTDKLSKDIDSKELLKTIISQNNDIKSELSGLNTLHLVSPNKDYLSIPNLENTKISIDPL
ncbi:hypothetical protein A1D15_0865 [Lactiplantibacillus plantarum]|uniref:hypothetical protein n=1 Tax=Lactiplantibacillus plantarum TaxID=1590 RepID=UPI0007B55F6A|nr:hypothetical protein [Lactiplantibacillus plantarum]KZU96028.1 hypothetical protein A1D15_0865 [Lactiplantibacillus plantarum]MDV9115414.1 hypothetical protein [Lactiplantibacillus plantarum]